MSLIYHLLIPGPNEGRGLIRTPSINWHHKWRRVSSKSHEWRCIEWYIAPAGRCITNPLENASVVSAIQEKYMSDIFLVKSHLIWTKKHKVQNCWHYFFMSKVILHSMKFEKRKILWHLIICQKTSLPWKKAGKKNSIVNHLVENI